MEEMYEVLKFIEHGTQCRQSMDCERGDLLIYYLRDNPQIEKEVLFEWFRQIGISLDQFCRCRSGRKYRYLNPYSIVVGENKRVYLLDLEAPENDPVLKKMQNRTVRNHFVRQAFAGSAGLAGDADLYGYGRTMQFVLAYTAVVPKLTRGEERKMMRVISRCTENLRNRYSGTRQAAGDIPSGTMRTPFLFLTGRKTAAAAGCLGVLAALGIILSGTDGQENRKSSVQASQKAAEDSAGEKSMIQPDAGETNGKMEMEDYISGAAQSMNNCLLQNTSRGNEQAILWGKELELNVVRSLAAAYEREEMTKEAILAYGRLLEIEEGTLQIENAAEKKMILEAEQEQYAQAVLTGEEALSRVENSEKIRMLTDAYRQKLEDGTGLGGKPAENENRTEKKEGEDE